MASRPRLDRRVATSVAAFVAAATYSAFLLAPQAGSRLPVSTSFPSELEAIGQPDAGWFRLADGVSGVLIVLALVGLYRLEAFGQRRRRGTLTPSLGALAMGLAGIASVTDAVTTMGCAPSSDPACRARDATVNGLLGQTLEAHTLSGLVGFVGASLGMVLLGFGLRPHARVWGTASVVVGFVLAGIGLVDLGLLLAHGPFGIAERARDCAVSVWLVGLGAYLLLLGRRSRASAADRQTARAAG